MTAFIDKNGAILEFDHLFICTAVGAPEADKILAIGLTEGSSNVHPGQGTANRRIFFQDAMLEFLWMTDAEEARSQPIAPTHLWERCQYQQTGYSPFGIGFRPATESSTEQTTTPEIISFPTWEFRPPYLPPHIHIDIASDTTSVEPLIFMMPLGRKPITQPADRREPLQHAIGFCEITKLHITLPSTAPFSAAVQSLNQTEQFTFSYGDEHFVEIEFDHKTQGQTIDFRPVLPLRFCW